MWIQSTLGDFSIVKHTNGKQWLVRSRYKKGMTTICKAMKLKKDRIVTYPKADYLYRIYLDEVMMVRLMHLLFHSITYPNFKNNETKKRSPKRLKQLYEVYNALKKP